MAKQVKEGLTDLSSVCNQNLIYFHYYRLASNLLQRHFRVAVLDGALFKRFCIRHVEGLVGCLGIRVCMLHEAVSLILS